MLDCIACIQRCVRVLLSDVLTTQPTLRRPQLMTARRRSPHDLALAPNRTYTTEPKRLPDVDRFLPNVKIRPRLSPAALIKAAEAETGQLEPTEEFHKHELEKELQWVRDPLKLADKIKHLLQRDAKDDQRKALALARHASKDMACTVSWNHLINYYMHRGIVSSAIKTYNEMKKRAQIPDAFTFTIIFSGLARNARYPKSLERALSIYHSMFADTAPVKASLTHTNAVLNVCALSNDLDAMLGVAAKLPTRGRGAPDRMTFTVILNAIRVMTMKDLDIHNSSSKIQLQKRDEAVLKGRRLWEEIRERWAKSDLWLDEELVCAMGRLLMIGTSDQEQDAVLSLLEQTMQIPRQVPPLADPARSDAAKVAPRVGRKADVESEQEEEDVFADLPMVDKPARAVESGRTDKKSDEEDAEVDRSTNTQIAVDSKINDSFERLLHFKEPKAVIPAQVVVDNKPELENFNPFAPLSRYLPDQHRVTPGPPTLSLAVEVCTALRLFKPAQDYWGLLTDAKMYNIEPDQQNYLAYLRLLRFQRQSRQALEIVQEMHSGALAGASRSRNYRDDSNSSGLPSKVFRIALSACARDKNNRHALARASELVRIMKETLETPDPGSLHSYLVCALGHEPRDYRIIMEAARSLIVPMRILRSYLTDRYARVREQPYKYPEIQRKEEEILKLAGKMIAAFDVALEEGKEIMKRPERKLCLEPRNGLVSWIERRKHKREEIMRANKQFRREKEEKAMEEKDGAAEIEAPREEKEGREEKVDWLKNDYSRGRRSQRRREDGGLNRDGRRSMDGLHDEGRREHEQGPGVEWLRNKRAQLRGRGGLRER